MFSKKERGRIWKDDIEGILNEQNDWNYTIKADAVEVLVGGINLDEDVPALKEMKTVKAHRLSEVSIS